MGKLAPGFPVPFALEVYPQPGFILASAAGPREQIVYLALLLHQYFRREGGLVGQSELRFRLAR